MKKMLIGVYWLILTGCAPGPPPPPLFGGPGALGIGWIILGLIAFGMTIIWKKTNETPSVKTDYITDALNDINERLKRLEEKMKDLEKNLGRDG